MQEEALDFLRARRIPLSVAVQPTEPKAQGSADFASLRFPGRTILNVEEVAKRLRVTKTHIVNLIDEGILEAVNVGTAERKFYRIPIEAYEAYVAKSGLPSGVASPASVKPGLSAALREGGAKAGAGPGRTLPAASSRNPAARAKAG